MAKEDKYELERHAAETERLHVQNEVFNRAVGYLLHPTIQKQLPASPRIAELATGAGDFLVDVAKTLPSTAKIDGFDISSHAFLPAGKLPANVTLDTSDARQPPRDEHKGQYDVVCIRFLNCGIVPDDWQPVAEHAWALLKPGGALQWIEGNLTQLLVPLRSELDTKTTALDKGSYQALGQLTHLNWFVSNLQRVLEDVGFRNVSRTATSSDRVAEDRSKMGWLCAGAFYSILRGQAHKGAPGALAEQEIEELYEEMVQEADNGAYTRADFHQFIAWKPS